MAKSTALARSTGEPDAETRATSDHHDALRLWLRMLATTNLIEAHVRRLLQDRFATTLPRFDLMAQLERVPDGLKMGELSRRMMVTGGNVTGITDLLEREGLVARIGDPDDRRALRVRLTAAGRRSFRAMAAAHERWIIEAFAPLDADELARLADLLGNLKSHIRRAEESTT
jgi:DNA-binding MarR family transcriptional regulator